MKFLLDVNRISAILGFIGVVLAIIFYYSSRQKKSLYYEVLSEYPLISIDDEIKGKLQIILDGNPVENVQLLLIKFLNDGKVPIMAADYARPISLKFKDTSDILSAEYVESMPQNLFTSSPEIKEKVVSIDPILMNSGDFFKIKVLVGQYSGTFDVDTRIAGIKQLRRVQKQGFTLTYLNLAFLAVISILVGIVVTYVFIPKAYPLTIGPISHTPSAVHINEMTKVEVTTSDKVSIIRWEADKGTFVESTKSNIAYYKAPETPGMVKIVVCGTRISGGEEVCVMHYIEILPLEQNPSGQSNKP